MFTLLLTLITTLFCLAVDEAVKTCYDAVFTNMGQCCCAGTRTFVHESIYDAFVEKATQLAQKRKIGNPFEGVEQGPQVRPLPTPGQVSRTLRIIFTGQRKAAD
jgi:aldehyde dehydrogenase (NAD+)